MAARSKRRVADLDAQPLSTRDLGTQAAELAAELLLGIAARGLLERLQAHDHPLPITADPAVAMEDGVEQVHPIAVFGVAVLEPVNELAACIPDRGGDEVEEVFPFVVDRLE